MNLPSYCKRRWILALLIVLTVTSPVIIMLPSKCEATGRMIDAYGGASNDEDSPFPLPFPPPQGGQGPNQPMGRVFPLSKVIMYANVTYNYWPVQQKEVSFQVEGPYAYANGHFTPKPNYLVLSRETARTDQNGVANITFAMPWPSENPESMLGAWKVTASANVRDVTVNDTLYFYYDYDAGIVCAHFGTSKGEAQYDSLYDITKDDYIGTDDIFIAAFHSFEEEPLLAR